MRQFLRLLVDRQARQEYMIKEPGDDSSIIRPSLPAPSLSLSQPLPQNHHQLGFFSLPVEIRQAILTHAFGGHFVHINLLPLTLNDLGEKRFSRYDSRTPQQKRRHKLWSDDKRRSTALLCWRGCICERTVPGDPSKRALHDENCLHGEGRCIEWPRSGPKSQSIDAMGFLLSCKQGYLDLVNIIYSANTIILNTDLLIDAVLKQAAPGGPRIISPAIHHTTSLELLVHFRLFQHWRPELQGDNPEEIRERKRFRLFLEELAEAFPHLKSLNMTFEYGLFYEYRNITHEAESIRTELAIPLMKLGGKLPQLRHFTVSLERHLFSLFRHLGGPTPEEDETMREKEGFFGPRAWYPWETPVKARGQPGSGFWVRMGPCRQIRRPDDNKLRWDDVCCPGCHRGCLG